MDEAGAGARGHHAHPLGPHAPEIWILGSSDYGAQLAAHFGLPYAFAYFFTDGQGAEQAIALYRGSTSRASAIRAAGDAASGRSPPQATTRRSTTRCRAIAGASIAAEASLGPLQAPAAIAARGFDPSEERELASMRARAFVGSARTVSDKISRLVEAFALDEVVINTWAHDPAVRRTSYALLAESFSLSAAARRT